MSSELSHLAVTEKVSKGRAVPQERHAYRSDFDRDRDRVIHCSAFRRLEGKSQVFTPGLDDYYRTRLTHSIEVAQIGRTIAKGLGLNDSLTEAICLAHDLGHSPFGHAGEKVLDDLMSEFGGFEHNQQTLRIVDLLEHPYPGFMGLNLMYETRLGLAKHRSPYDQVQVGPFSELNCSLEGQIANVADRIAYNCHDLEDGMRARIISREMLKGLAIFAEAEDRIGAETISDRTIRRTRTAKAIMNNLVSDCLQTSNANLAEAGVKAVDDIYPMSDSLVSLSAGSQNKLSELEEFLLQNFYLHATLLETTDQVKDWLGDLFEMLCRDPKLMPGYFQRFVPKHGLQRAVCDYIAGMTDRFCLKMLEGI